VKQIHVKLPESLHKELRIQAAIKGRTLQDYVIEAIQRQVNSDKAANNSYTIKESVSSDNTERTMD
jgi:Arc/MetJ-type ribon-helix-helix transcriptional regulator